MNELLERKESRPLDAALPPSASLSPNAARAVASAPPPRRAAAPVDLDDEDNETFWERNRINFIVAAVVLIGGAWATFALRGKSSTVQKAPPREVIIQVAPPPPPPPPPKLPPPPPPEPKMVEQTPMIEEPKPDDKPEPPKEAEPALGTNIKGNGQGDGFGLSGSKGGGMLGGTGGNGGRAGSRWGGYAGQVQNRIADALRRNSRTKSAKFTLQARVWADTTGRITRVTLAGSSGDPAVDAAIRNEALTGLQLTEPPPPGMPMPIVLRLSARGSN